MSEPINDGGPAFPRSPVIDPVDCSVQHKGNPGMTLRDWFAGQALVGLIAEPKTVAEPPHRIAKAAYLVADAMLKARGGGV